MNEGATAWQHHGVTGRDKNPYQRGTAAYVQWDNEFMDAWWAARFSALDDAKRYHALA